ncbi:MAG: flavodoxin-dependent (E)-4-hydroxy-3-methylbut-2-enyl-diphosphate synthase, partial [Chloroflexota bacterium]
GKGARGLGLPDYRTPYEYTRRASCPVAVGLSAFGGGQPVRVFHPFPGELARVERAAERALALASADGLVRARPDALSVLVRTEADAAALGALRTVLDGASAELPLVVCVPPDFAGLAAVARDADLVSLNVGGDDAEPPLIAALETVAAARRPVLLEAAPDAAEPDTARAVAGAVERALAAARLATAAGCVDVALSASARDTGLALRTYRLLAARLAEAGAEYPIHLLAWPHGDATEALLRASVLLGALLCDGIGDSIQIMGATRQLDDAARARLAFNVLQGAGVRLSKTEFVACPSCGRTLFNLQETTERIQRMTGHLKGVRIAIMGCIVNGPGEMADADFGYVGGAPGKVNLYVGKECVEKGVPAAMADDRLIALIRAHGKWVDPPLVSVN